MFVSKHVILTFVTMPSNQLNNFQFLQAHEEIHPRYEPTSVQLCPSTSP